MYFNPPGTPAAFISAALFLTSPNCCSSSPSLARLGELEQQFGLVKNSAADMKAAGVPGGLKYISGSHSGVPEGGMAVWKYLSLAICMMGGNRIVTSYSYEILYNSYC